MTRALQTRQVGLTTHASGHVMAPPDIVYEVEEEKRPDRSRLFIEEWSAPNLWVTVAIWVFVVVPCFAYGIWHVLTN